MDVKSTGLYTRDKVLLKINVRLFIGKPDIHIKRKVNSESLAGFEKSGHFFSINQWGMVTMMVLIQQFKLSFIDNQNKK